VEVEAQVERWHCHLTLEEEVEVEVVVQRFHGHLALGAEVVGEEEVQSSVFVLQKT
jgi:hypothetical protein